MVWNTSPPKNYMRTINSYSDSEWQQHIDDQKKQQDRLNQLNAGIGSWSNVTQGSRWSNASPGSNSSSVSSSSYGSSGASSGASGSQGSTDGSNSSSTSFFDSSKMGGLLDTAKQFGDYGFGLQSKGWELANKYRMSEAGQQIEGQKDIANIGQSGETNRLGMSIAGEQRLEDTRQGGLTTRQQSQLAEQQRAQLAAFQNQTQQKAQDAARARLAFIGRL